MTFKEELEELVVCQEYAQVLAMLSDMGIKVDVSGFDDLTRLETDVQFGDRLALLVRNLPNDISKPASLKWKFYTAKSEMIIEYKDVFEENRTELITTLLARYQTHYKSKITDENILQTLKLVYTDRMNKDYVEDVKLPTTNTGITNLVDELYKYGKILLIGGVGMGKTTYLLDTAIKLLQKAEKKNDAPMPYIVNLMSWKSDTYDFQTWLMDTLKIDYNFPKEEARFAIENGRIIPFLDGFDEIGRDLTNEKEVIALRQNCIQILQKYQSKKNAAYIICSSALENQQLHQLPIKAAISIQSISSDAIKELLQKQIDGVESNSKETAANNLLAEWNTNSALREVLSTPLYFNLAFSIWKELGEGDIPTEKNALETYILDSYIARQLGEDKNAVHYLGWVAEVVQREKVVNFELTTFQPYHLRNNWIYRVLLGLLAGLLGGALMGLALGWIVGEALGLMGGLVGGLGVGFFLGLTEGKYIETYEVTEDFTKIFHYQTLVKGLAGGLVAGLFGYWAFGLTFGLVVGLTFGLVVSISTFSSSLRYFQSRNPFVLIHQPYQHLFSNILIENIIFTGLIFGRVAYHHTQFPTDWMWIDYLWRAVIIFPMLSLGGSLFRHFYFRFVVCIEGNMPLRWVYFLNAMCKRGILERDGGGWQFRHQLLLDRFLKKRGR